MKLVYLTLEEILRLHFQVVKDFGGSQGIRDEGHLASVIAAPQQIVLGEGQYASVFDKAAVYLRNIIGDHPFTDDNKRTAVVVCGIFLMRSKHFFHTSPEALEHFAVRVAVERLSVPEISVWLETHTS